jgi:secreted trypsin-like serine protease
VWRFNFVLASLLLGACGGAQSAQNSRSRAAIVGGTDDPADPAVVAFVVGGLPFCSGTLIAPRTVLTAGHCANLIGKSDGYTVAFGEDASHPTRSVKVAAQVQHPQYTAEGAPYDFALLQLADPVNDIAPARLGTAPLGNQDVGRSIRHVGFGVNDESAGTGRGTKRQASYPITEVDPLIVWSGGPGEQTCDGDSGGPGFLARDGGEELAAVVSDGPNCHDAGWDGRVDVVAPWIAQTEAAWEIDAGQPVADGGAPDSSSGGCASASGSNPLGGAALIFAFAIVFLRAGEARRRLR